MFDHRHYSAAIVLLGWWDPWIAICAIAMWGSGRVIGSL